MNKVPIIRKGSIKPYWSNGCGGGLMIGFLVFLLSLINNSVLTSLHFGMGIWIGIIVIWIGLGFTSQEYYKRKKKIKNLTSNKYAFLDLHNFTLHEDLYFEGVYREFFFRVLPTTGRIPKRKGRGIEIEYIVIEAFYNYDTASVDSDREEKMCGDYFIGHVHFANHCAGFISKDWDNPDFKENFDGLINIFKREKLYPLMKDDWESTYGEKLRKSEEEEEEARTKQIFKIGKILKITYRKPDEKVN